MSFHLYCGLGVDGFQHLNYKNVSLIGSGVDTEPFAKVFKEEEKKRCKNVQNCELCGRSIEYANMTDTRSSDDENNTVKRLVWDHHHGLEGIDYINPFRGCLCDKCNKYEGTSLARISKKHPDIGRYTIKNYGHLINEHIDSLYDYISKYSDDISKEKIYDYMVKNTKNLLKIHHSNMIRVDKTERNQNLYHEILKIIYQLYEDKLTNFDKNIPNFRLCDFRINNTLAYREYCRFLEIREQITYEVFQRSLSTVKVVSETKTENCEFCFELLYAIANPLTEIVWDTMEQIELDDWELYLGNNILDFLYNKSKIENFAIRYDLNINGVLDLNILEKLYNWNNISIGSIDLPPEIETPDDYEKIGQPSKKRLMKKQEKLEKDFFLG